ncbi:MAG: hypothetical protein UY72_C0023G0007 [Candidatus Uhrbacteria bacterium GW2011_GWD2_52_7]|uniref:Uncharacterized protein n=1 Tax=Candidatus Uhrbacteria bacterium GW2011_GWD2_52_7 TaxID=1618989 RepID=A0A0G1XGQ1_9BACT|nr:MAG: hypothetical protein UY72_C0023G0007 [Candidatus Uhrbacteria bacterium GW2011_GWD2_52_7]
MRFLNLADEKPLRSGDSLELDEAADIERLGGGFLMLRVKGGDGLVIDDLGNWIIEQVAHMHLGFAIVIAGTWKNPAFNNLPVNLRVRIDLNGRGFVTFT